MTTNRLTVAALCLSTVVCERLKLEDIEKPVKGKQSNSSKDQDRWQCSALSLCAKPDLCIHSLESTNTCLLEKALIAHDPKNQRQYFLATQMQVLRQPSVALSLQHLPPAFPQIKPLQCPLPDIHFELWPCCSLQHCRPVLWAAYLHRHYLWVLLATELIKV